MLLTRLPLTPKDAFDLHVLSLPPAFVLSQDQTLMLEEISIQTSHCYPAQSKNQASLDESQNTSLLGTASQRAKQCGWF